MLQDNLLVVEQKEKLNVALFTDWLNGPVHVALLELAIELALPDILQEVHTPKEIATRLGGANETSLLYVLDALAALGLVIKKEGRYSNASLAATYLRKGQPTYIGDLILRLRSMQHRNLPRLKELLFSGPSTVRQEQRLDANTLWERSAREMAAYQKGDVAQALANIAASLPEFPHFRRMLDLGCGPGVIGLAIMRRHPELAGVFCDLPPVIAVAQEEAVAAGMIDRAGFYPGDYNDIDFGSGYDLIWASQNLYFAKNLPLFIEKLFASLNPGGVFISVHEGLTDERTAPAKIVVSRLSLALEGQDVSFAFGAIADLAIAAGFVSLERRSAQMLFGENEVVILRKPGALGERQHGADK